MNWIFDGFGWQLWQKEDGTYTILNGEGDEVYTAKTTFEAKKWMKEHKTSEAWDATGKWHWDRIKGED